MILSPMEIVRHVETIPFSYGAYQEILFDLKTAAGQTTVELDTGSFMSVFPKSSIEELGLNPKSPSQIYGLDGVVQNVLYGSASNIDLGSWNNLGMIYDEMPIGYGMQYPLLGREFFIENNMNFSIDFAKQTITLSQFSFS